MTDTSLVISTAARVTAVATARTAVGTGVMAGVFFALPSPPAGGGQHLVPRVLGCALFLVGAIGLTAVVNVPLNNDLAAVDPTSAAGQSLWRDYLSRWTRYNDVRALSSVLATALLVWAARS